MGPDVNLKTVAKATVGFTGADLENVVNEAALLAARANKRAITMKEIEDATIKAVSYTHLDVYKRQGLVVCGQRLFYL